MGAQLVVRTHSDCPLPELKAWVNEQSRQDQSEYGSSYSGHWNMAASGLHVPTLPVFDTYEAAEEYIQEKHQKWEALIAVKARQAKLLMLGDTQADKAHVDLTSKLKEISHKLMEYPYFVLKRVKGGSAKLKKCTGCSSHISVAHLRSINCPVCGHDLLYTETDLKALAALREKEKTLKLRVKEREDALRVKKYKSSAPYETVWVIGGWCAS